MARKSASRPAQTLTVGRRRIDVTHPEKPLFPKDGIRKIDFVDYYRRVADCALPHWRDRPVSMQRFPDGIGGGIFFQKQVPDYFPDWIGRVRLAKEGGHVTHAVCNDAATMVYLANQVCVPHLGLSRIDRIRNPDRLIIDLDPSDGDFGKVRAAARAAHRLLGELDLVSFVMTTGSRGLHIVLPLDRRADFAAVKPVAAALCDELAARDSVLMTTEKRKAKRGSRVFLDYLRNDYAQTGVAPYAVRPKPGAPVATPLDWSEVGAGGLTAQKFTLENLFRRLSRKDDPWADIGTRRQGLARAARALEAMRRERKRG